MLNKIVQSSISWLDSSYRYHPNELYDYMVRRLFKNLLHKADEHRITFSKRGKSDRTASLEQALHRAKNRFLDEKKAQTDSVFRVIPKQTKASPCLQATDYLLWALQRFYERHEKRYLEYLWPKFRLVHDIDDTRKRRYGEYYTKERPIFEVED